jgi:hypothetical protein
MCGLVDALRKAAGPISSSQAYQLLLQDSVARAEDVSTVQASGETRFAKEVRFARQELEYAGLVENIGPGTWGLTERGWSTALTVELARDLVRRRRHSRAAREPEDYIASPMSQTRGPTPSSWTATVTHRSDGPAWTYVLRFGITNVWKIGFSTDVEARVGLFNQHIPTEVDAVRWVLFSCYPWHTALLAYRMEQELLSCLTSARTVGERVMCEADAVVEAWRSSMARFLTAARDAGSVSQLNECIAFS